MKLKPLYDIIDYLGIFQKYLGVRMYIVYLLGVIASVFEGLGILMLLPLLESLDGNNTSQAPHFINDIILNVLSFLGFSQSISSILILISLAFVFKGIITFSALAYRANLIGELLKEIKQNLYALYSLMDFRYYTSKNTGDFINLINEQPTRAIQAFLQLTILGSQLINTFILMCLAFTMTFSFGMMSLLVGVLLLLLFLRMNSYVQNLSRITAKENGILTKWLIQFLHGFKYLSSTNQIKKLNKNILKSISVLTNNQIKSGIAGAFTQSVREPLAVVLIMIIVYVQLVILELQLEPILVSIALFYRALNSTLAVQSAFQATFDTIGSMELVDQEFENQKKNQIKSGKKVFKKFKSEIQLQNITFKYNTESNIVLDSIDIQIPYKKSIAIVGKSGSGKTTIVDLILSIIKPQKGKILIDKQPIENIDINSWRDQIGYVSQDNIIFDDTIANNISMWQDTENEDYTKNIINVLKKANILEFIDSLPDGINTKIGDRGVMLSGGQKQRIFIARELYRNPSVLILDEATSSLDSESENRIQDSINNLQGHITLIIIAHRLSTIKNVNQIYLIDKGKVIESGTFHDLKSNTKSKFKELTEIQNL